MLKDLAIGRAAKHLPWLKWLALAEIAVLAGRHVRHLQPAERRRLLALMKRGHRATSAEREELRTLVSKIDLRGLAGGAAAKLSPVPLPRRFTRSRY